ncbi:MAG: DUF4493 domain-containing protein [Bacteroidales bacterium]|nr:DUF4493 domain-containing protein [Bacteroidales bacterium]
MNRKIKIEMKKIFFPIIAAAAIFTGCNREVIEQTGTGSLAVDLTCKSNLHEVVTRATDDEIINDLVIDIQRPYDNWTKTYDPFSSIRGKVVELGSGDYILTASSASKEHAAFDQPIYSGSKDFKILTGQVTTVDVICAITNVKVTVNLSDNFVQELSGYTVTVSNGKGNLSWNKNAGEDDFKPVAIEGQTYYTGNEAGWFTAAPLSITIDGHRAIDNTSASATMIIEDVKAADHHVLNIDAKVTGTLGGINITINHDVNEIDQNIVIPGFDEEYVPGDEPSDGSGDDTGEEGGNDDNTGNEPVDPTPSTAPYLVWEANPSFAPMNIDDDLNADLVVNAPKKVKTFEVIVDSEALSPTVAALCSYADSYESGPAVMDMIGDATLLENLAGMGLGLPLGDEILGKETVPFYLTSLIGLINIYGPEPGAQHKFTLKVTDEEGGILEQLVVFVSI